MGGFLSGLSGFAQGFSQSYNQARRDKLDRELKGRDQMAQFYTKLIESPDIRPEAKPALFNHYLQLINEQKFDDKVAAKYRDLGKIPGFMDAPEGAIAPAKAQGGGVDVGTGTLPGGELQSSIPAPPPYSPWLTEDEKNQRTVAQLSAEAGAKERGALRARMEAVNQFPGLNELQRASGVFPAMDVYAPSANISGMNILERAISGERLLKEFPDAMTPAGTPPVEGQSYTLATDRQTQKTIAIPSGAQYEYTRLGEIGVDPNSPTGFSKPVFSREGAWLRNESVPPPLSSFPTQTTSTNIQRLQGGRLAAVPITSSTQRVLPGITPPPGTGSTPTPTPASAPSGSRAGGGGGGAGAARIIRDESGQPLEGVVSEGLRNLRTVAAKMDEDIQIVKEIVRRRSDLTGFIQGNVQRFLAKYRGSKDKDAAELVASLARIKDNELRIRSGAQIGQYEYPRLEEFLPTIQSPDLNFITKLEQLEQQNRIGAEMNGIVLPSMRGSIPSPPPGTTNTATGSPQQSSIPEGATGTWRGQPVVRRGGRWVLAQ